MDFFEKKQKNTCDNCFRTGKPHICTECETKFTLCNIHDEKISCICGGEIYELHELSDDDFPFQSKNTNVSTPKWQFSIRDQDSSEDPFELTLINHTSKPEKKVLPEEEMSEDEFPDDYGSYCIRCKTDSDLNFVECSGCDMPSDVCTRCLGKCFYCGELQDDTFQKNVSAKIKEIKKESKIISIDSDSEDEPVVVLKCKKSAVSISQEVDSNLDENPEFKNSLECSARCLLDFNNRQSGKGFSLPAITVSKFYCSVLLCLFAQYTEAMSKMTINEWIVNTCVNRLKHPDLMSGKASALCFSRMEGNANLATAVLEQIKERSLHLMKTTQKVFHATVINLIDQSISVNVKSPLKTFIELNGLTELAAQQWANGAGGLGRQQGEGDETHFKAACEDAVTLIRKEWTTREGKPVAIAGLHNPDQCAGGPMEILWDEEEKRRLILAKNNYRKTKETINNLKNRLLEAEFGTIILANPIATKKLLDDLEPTLPGLQKIYLGEVKRHLGLNNINTKLGGYWIPQNGEGALYNLLEMAFFAVDDGNGEKPMSVGIQIEITTPTQMPQPVKKRKEPPGKDKKPKKKIKKTQEAKREENKKIIQKKSNNNTIFNYFSSKPKDDPQ